MTAALTAVTAAPTPRASSIVCSHFLLNSAASAAELRRFASSPPSFPSTVCSAPDSLSCALRITLRLMSRKAIREFASCSGGCFATFARLGMRPLADHAALRPGVEVLQALAIKRLQLRGRERKRVAVVSLKRLVRDYGAAVGASEAVAGVSVASLGFAVAAPSTVEAVGGFGDTAFPASTARDLPM